MEALNGLHSKRNPKFRGVFNGFCALILFFLFYNQGEVMRSPNFKQSSMVIDHSLALDDVWNNGSSHLMIIHRKMAENSVNFSNSANNLSADDPVSCTGLIAHKGFANQCEYLKANPQCSSGGFFDYIRFFYCDCGGFKLLGYAVLIIWLVALFYLLDNTAVDYFCCSLEKLSRLLRLPPTIEKLAILLIGKVSVGAAIAFVSIYIVYAFFVATNEILRKHVRRLKLDVVTPLLPVRGSVFSQGSDDDISVYSSLLETDDTDDDPPYMCLPFLYMFIVLASLKMMYVKPLKLYQELIKKNTISLWLSNWHRLICLDIRNEYLNLAVSNPNNTIAMPLWQENDLALMEDKFRTLISNYNVAGFIVRLPSNLNPTKPNPTIAKQQVGDFVKELSKSRKLRGLMYTYWDDLATLKGIDFAFKHHVEFMFEHLHLSEEVSKEIMDKFAATRVLQAYLDCVNVVAEIDKEQYYFARHLWVECGKGDDPSLSESDL